MSNSDQGHARLGQRLREARDYLELSQDEVARKMNLPRTAIVQIEAGNRKVNALELARFSEIYQRPSAYFTSEVEVSAALPDDVVHLARAAKQLSPRDRQELQRFAEFLNSRASAKGSEDAE